MGFRILCTGDVHLGRRPARIPEGLDAHALGPAAAWDRFVSAAIERKVNAAVLTGDVVDESNLFFETFGPLQSGVGQLVAAGIEVLAVSGNHDFKVLPDLADQIPEFRLLGRGGRWEQTVLKQDGAAVRFLGWSFPRREVSTSPLADCPPINDDLPTVGLLHCDCDVPASSYGPVLLANLKAKAPAAWLLGHIHKPQLLSPSLPLILYPGSPQGLDPSEQGPHGAWLITIQPGQAPSAEHVPLAGLRWEQIDVPLDEVSDEQALEKAVVAALREKHDEIKDETSGAKVVGCRLRLRGRTCIGRHLPGVIPDIQALTHPFEDAEYFVEKVEDLSRPDLPLEEIALSSDPAGLLAKRIIVLDRREPAEDYRELIHKARPSIEEKRAEPTYASPADGTDELTDDRVREALLTAALSILDELLAQKEPGA